MAEQHEGSPHAEMSADLDGPVSRAAGGWPDAPSPSTLVLCLGYRGQDFAGFAEQPGQRTVAGELRRALETLLRRPAELVCAGRTDAGVHAIAQYVSVALADGELPLGGDRLLRALTALTPDDVSIRAAYRAPAKFSARFDALARGYRYRLAVGPRPVHGWGRVWWLRKSDGLDLNAMASAAACLVGEHDFSSFCKGSSAALIRSEGRSTSREVLDMTVSSCVEAGDMVVHVDLAANAFLHNMVRVIVGSLVEVGCGRREPTWMGEVLAACDRRAAGPTAPPWGLTLERVEYPAGSLRPW